MHTSIRARPLVDEATRAAWARTDAERERMYSAAAGPADLGAAADQGAATGSADLGAAVGPQAAPVELGAPGRPKKAARAFKAVTVRVQGRRAVRLQAREGLTVGAALAEAADVLADRKPVRARRAAPPVALLYFGRPVGELAAPPGATCGDAAAAAAAALPGHDWHCVAPTAEGGPRPYGVRPRLLPPDAPLAAALLRGGGLQAVEVCARAPGEPLCSVGAAGAAAGRGGPAGRVVAGDWLRARGVRGAAAAYALGPPPALAAPADQRWADPAAVRRPGFAALDAAAPAPRTLRAVVVD